MLYMPSIFGEDPGPKIKGGLTYVVHAWYFW